MTFLDAVVLLVYTILGVFSCSEHYHAGVLVVDRHAGTGRALEKLLTSEGSQTSLLCRSLGTQRLMPEGGSAVAYSILGRAEASMLTYE